ncbi:MAG: hypothetical protein WBW01_03480, partial [Terriglobales bacterium]
DSRPRLSDARGARQQFRLLTTLAELRSAGQLTTPAREKLRFGDPGEGGCPYVGISANCNS